MSMYLQALGLNCALGHDKASVAKGLFAGDCSGMQPVLDWVPEQSLICGQVQLYCQSWMSIYRYMPRVITNY